MNASSNTTVAASDNGWLVKTAGYYAVFILLGMTAASLGPTLPGLAQHVGVPLSLISFSFSARSFGYLLGSLYGGRLVDRLPSHRLIAVMLLGMGGMLALAPLSPWLLLLVGILLLLGIAEGAVDVSGNVSLVWVHRQRVGPFMNGLHFFFGLGAFLSPLGVAQIMRWTGDIYWTYWGLGLLTILPAAWLIRLESPRHLPTSTAETSHTQAWLLVALITLFYFAYVGLESSYGGWIYTYTLQMFKDHLAGDPAMTAAWMTSAFWGAFTVGRLTSIPLALRVRPRTILAVDLAGCLASILLIVLFPASDTVLWVGTLGFGFFNAAIFPTMLTFAGQYMTVTGSVMRWFFMGTGAGGMTLPWLIGQLITPFGPIAVMVAIFVDVIIAGVLFVAIAMLTRARVRNASEN